MLFPLIATLAVLGAAVGLSRKGDASAEASADATADASADAPSITDLPESVRVLSQELDGLVAAVRDTLGVALQPADIDVFDQGGGVTALASADDPMAVAEAIRALPGSPVAMVIADLDEGKVGLVLHLEAQGEPVRAFVIENGEKREVA